MRKLWISLAVIGLILVAVGYFGAGSLTKGAIRKAVERVLGVEVEISAVKIDPVSGKMLVSGIKVHNPEGFSQPLAVEIAALEVSAAGAGALAKDVVEIKSITINDPVLYFEVGLNGNNLYTLQGNAQRYSNSMRDSEKAKKEKRVVIKTLQLTQPKLRIAPGDPKDPEAKSLELPLDDITVNNIGDENQPASTALAIVRVLKGIIIKLPLTDSSIVRDTMDDAKGLLDDAAGKARSVFGQ